MEQSAVQALPVSQSLLQSTPVPPSASTVSLIMSKNEQYISKVFLSLSLERFLLGEYSPHKSAHK